MLVFILDILLLFCFLFYSVKAERTSRTFHVFIAIVLIVIAGFRYYVGVDYEAYREMYLGTDDTGYLRIIEPGWRFLYDLLHSIGGTYNLWFIVISSLTIIPIAYGIKQMSPCVVLSWMFFIGSFLYTESFNACRQYVAMAFLFAGTPFLLAKQFVKFLMVICVAMLFHNSAIIGVAFLFLLRPYSTKFRLIVLISTLFLGEYILRTFVMGWLSSFMSSFISVLDLQRSYSYDLYSHSDNLINTGVLKYVYNVLAIIVCMLSKRLDTRYTFFINAFVMAICWYNLFYIFQEYLRMHQYFLMYGMVLYPAFVYSFKYMVRPILALSILAVFLVFTTKSSWDETYRKNPTYALFENR